MALAIFDLDNTLLNGDSDYLWGVFLCEIGVVDATDYQEKNHSFHQQYLRGELDILEFLAFSLRPLAENDPQQLRQWRAQFLHAKIQPIITPAAIELVEQHRRAGDTLLIITATNTFITRPIADLFGIPHLIGTEPAMNGERYTGQVEGTPSFREGKVTRLNTWLTETGEHLAGASFYSDSHNDLPLLERVERPVAVNPDPQLLMHAQQHAWPVLDLHGNPSSVA